ncbi:MAG: hypothetical protein ACRYGI_01180 [Janthinobacterium lividum]
MTSEFPLLSAVLEQSFGPLPPAGDIGRVLGALGIANSSYHSFEPPRPPEAPPAEVRIPEPPPAMLPTNADDSVVETAHVEPAPAVPTYSGHAAADPLRPEPKLQEPLREAPVWTTPTLGIPTRTEPRMVAQAAPAPLRVYAMAERAPNDPARSRDQPGQPAAPERAATQSAGSMAPDPGNTTGSQGPAKQQLSLSGLFRILGAPTQAQAAPSRTLRDVFGYSNKRNS